MMSLSSGTNFCRATASAIANPGQHTDPFDVVFHIDTPNLKEKG